MAVNSSENKPGPQAQLHLPNKQQMNMDQLQFKSVNHSIDQMKELSQTFDFHSQSKWNNTWSNPTTSAQLSLLLLFFKFILLIM